MTPSMDSISTDSVRSVPDLASDRARRMFRGYGLELLTAFAVGALMMNFVYLDARGYTGERVGVPGYDAFYHIKMAEMLPEVGLVHEFPWLRFVYFTQHDDTFVSHHYGFHVLLAPFVHLSQYLVGDAIAGGRWAISVFFGLSVVLLNLLLIRERLPWRWMWLLLFLMLPNDFFLRHSYVRAISPSLVFMLGILLLMFQRRWILAGIAVGLYNHLYLGAVIYGPLLVIAYVAASLMGPREDRRLEWKLALSTLCGWGLSILVHPYRRGMLEFLQLQVFGSGLSPDIAVGVEWNAYGNVWSFAAGSCGPLLAAWSVALCLRVRYGPRLTREHMTVLLLHFGFLALTLKAQRFIEYWPVMGLLSTAYLAAPLLRSLAERVARLGRSSGSARSVLLRAAWVLGGAALAVALIRRRGTDMQNQPALTEWVIWTALACLFVLPSLARIWCVAADRGPSASRRALGALWLPVFGALIVGGAYVLVRFVVGGDLSKPVRLAPWYAGLLVACGAYLLAAFLGVLSPRQSSSSSSPAAGPGRRLWRTMGLIVATSAVTVFIPTVAGERMVRAQRLSYCGYDLPAIKNVMHRLKEISQPGDVVFTDDWDVFPVYFYYNAYNNYIVGLDPKFTQARRPELWARYVKISRGDVPGKTVARVVDETGKTINKPLDVDLHDIREQFGARYVLVDGDHRNLARALAEAPELAELVYPSPFYKQAKDAPYLLFHIFDEDRPERQSPSEPKSVNANRQTPGGDDRTTPRVRTGKRPKRHRVRSADGDGEA